MKMGTIASPWRYDAEAFVAIQPVNLRWPAISRYSLADGNLPNFEAWSGPCESGRRSGDGRLLRFALRQLGYNYGTPKP
jgi:hypothetical protein